MSFESDSYWNKSTGASVMSGSSHQLSRKQRNSATRRSDQICHFFSKPGGCKAESCPYLHIQRDEDEAVNQESSVGAPGASQSTVSTYQPTKECYSFSQFGHCRFGSKCRFLHIDIHDDQYQHEEGAVKKNTKGPGNFPKAKPFKKAPRPCVAFERNGNCRYGASCRYLHSDPQTQDSGHEKDSGKVKEENDHVKVQPKASGPGPATSQGQHRPRSGKGSGQARKLCKFYKAGHCSMGQRCRFWHPQELPDVLAGCKISEENEPQVDSKETNSGVRSVSQGTDGHQQQGRSRVIPRPAVHRSSEYILEVLTDEAAKQLCATEVDLLKKRYPRAETNDDGSFGIIFKPTDPDWPYDVAELKMEVSFPGTYPKEMIKCILPSDERLPDPVKRCVSRGIDSWLKDRFLRLEKKGRVELVFRPFLRWLDKNIEDLFTEGLKNYQKQLMAEAAGIQIIPAEELKEKFAAQSASQSEEDSAPSAEEDAADEAEEEGLTEEAKQDQASAGQTMLDPHKHGTEVKLHNLQLRESAASLTATSIGLVIQCTRCKNTTEITTPPTRVNSVVCNRCSATQLVTFRAGLVHQFSSVLGYLDLAECTAFDMVLSECEFKVGCLGCSKEMAMQGLPPGQPKDTWCRHCHEKMRIAAETTRFLLLQPSVTTGNTGRVHKIETKGPGKAVKDPAIQLGQPLPKNGTCRHYKKSFRWLRFPCCGKAYPCDVCHEENETDHEMKFANRMICGFCCKEQAFAINKPCSGCESQMTKQTSAHWEGGKGCRDKIKMSRGDNKKYASSNKTVSKSSQKEGTAKKNTKLRHV